MSHRIAIAALVSALLLVGGAGAESPQKESSQPKPAAAGPCAADMDRFCKKIERGGGKRRTCLLSHASELAPECRAQLQAARPTGTTTAASVAIPARLVACEADVKALCPGVEPGRGRLRACLDLHVGKLTPDCVAALKGRARPAK